MSSFIDQILDVGSSVWKTLTGDGVAGGIAKATALGLLLNEVTNSINKDNQKPEAANTNNPNYSTRTQVDPDTDHSIPVVYGQAFIGGKVTDAVLTNSNQTMWYCLTICEKTGTKIDGTASVISFQEIYWNELKINFQGDGVTVASFTDEDGNTDTGVNGLVKIYLFNNGSTGATKLQGLATGNTLPAYSIFPNWTANHTMNELVFALVRVDYSAEKQLTGLGDVTFKLQNTLTEPGDVLYDYMTNTRYGAGIVAEEIYTS